MSDATFPDAVRCLVANLSAAASRSLSRSCSRFSSRARRASASLRACSSSSAFFLANNSCCRFSSSFRRQTSPDGGMGLEANREKAPSYQFLLSSLFFRLLLLLQFLLALGSCFFLGLLLCQALQAIRPERSALPGDERAQGVAAYAYLVLHLNLSHFLLNLLLLLFLPLLFFHFGLKHSF